MALIMNSFLHYNSYIVKIFSRCYTHT